MKKVIIGTDEDIVSVNCPNCDNWEALGIDDPRKRLNSLPIIKWFPDSEDTNEKSIHKCTDCDNEFQVEWDYRTCMTQQKCIAKQKEMSLLCCIIRENKIINSTLFESFDKIFEIADAFIEQYRNMKNVSSVTLTSATALSADALEAIKSKLITDGTLSKNIEFQTKVDASLIGGFRLEFGDKLYDASVAYKLEQLKKQLLN